MDTVELLGMIKVNIIGIRTHFAPKPALSHVDLFPNVPYDSKDETK